MKVDNALAEASEEEMKGDTEVVQIPMQVLSRMKFSDKADLLEAAAWLECDDAFGNLSEISKVLLDLQRLKETNYFEMMKKIV